MIHESIERSAADTKRRSPNPSLITRKSREPESYRAGALRQLVGNQGIQRLMRELSSGNSSGFAPLRAPSIQTKLAISKPGDAHEQEADRVADAVMRAPATDGTCTSAVASTTVLPAKVQRLCTECEEDQKHQAMLSVQRKKQAADTPPVTSSAAANIHALRGGGSALPATTRAFFEPRFCTDFSDVRVQTGTRAGEAAAAINAKAFTVGSTIVFGAGHYAPHSREGRHLLAHELTHVLQQGERPSSGSVEPDRVQRTIGDKHDLSSPRFKGDVDLEACYDDEARLTMGGLGRPGTRKIEHGASVMKVQQALIDLGYLAAGSADGNFTKLTWDAVKALKTKEGLGWETMGDVGPGTMEFLDKKFPPATCPPCSSTAPRPAGCAPCPPVPCPPCPSPDPRPAGCPPCGAPTPAPHVCGPDIDGPLTKVLGDMQTHFRALGGWAKHWSCQWLITPPMAIMAWDIHQLFLPETGWLRMSPFRPACGAPPAAPGGDVEDPATCSNSVRVGGKCNLAGTANYAAFGIMAKECHSYYSGSPALWTWKANIPFFTETGMKGFIGAYKTVTFDDTGPPKEFAVATYKGGPSGRPPTENRSHCSSICPSTHATPAFTFVWEPYQAR